MLTQLPNELLDTVLAKLEYDDLEILSKFSSIANIKLVVRRVLSSDLRPGMEHDYAYLCLELRSVYMHTPTIRSLHDSKYRRRSTKYPLAPFLPRDYTWLWRAHCTETANPFKQHSCPSPRVRERHIRFAQFFGSLFEVTSLYLESNLDGTFEECVREALVSGNAESLLALCVAADRSMEPDELCMSVSQAGEELWSYLDTVEDWRSVEPVSLRETQEAPPDWMMPERYKVNDDTKLRLKWW
ncbi:hypothetical protein BDF14DRAFT_1741931 [Spinellus fusiger]|nr:hypothetical protein BDF14DRAFT_1741931 [Spinellus fusiger]